MEDVDSESLMTDSIGSQVSPETARIRGETAKNIIDEAQKNDVANAARVKDDNVALDNNAALDDKAVLKIGVMRYPIDEASIRRQRSSQNLEEPSEMPTQLGKHGTEFDKAGAQMKIDKMAIDEFEDGGAVVESMEPEGEPELDRGIPGSVFDDMF